MIDCKCKATNVSKYGNMSQYRIHVLIEHIQYKILCQRNFWAEPRVVQGFKESRKKAVSKPESYKPLPDSRLSPHPPPSPRLSGISSSRLAFYR